jgi:hypothetical protein
MSATSKASVVIIDVGAAGGLHHRWRAVCPNHLPILFEAQQGHELAVLQGSGNSLSDLVGVEVEVSFLEVYRGQPLFCDIHQFLTGYGFQLHDLEKSFFVRSGTSNYGIRKGQAVVGMALYFLPPEDLVQRDRISEAKVIRAMKTYLAYGYCDVAETCWRLAESHKIISATTSGLLASMLRKLAFVPVSNPYELGTGGFTRLENQLNTIAKRLMFGRRKVHIY